MTLDEIEQDIGPADCALVLHPDGSTSFCIPKISEDAEPPEYVLALTEIALRMGEPGHSIEELAEAFKARKPI